jgi:hypothetical protein
MVVVGRMNEGNIQQTIYTKVSMLSYRFLIGLLTNQNKIQVVRYG